MLTSTPPSAGTNGTIGTHFGEGLSGLPLNLLKRRSMAPSSPEPVYQAGSAMHYVRTNVPRVMHYPRGGQNGRVTS